jgi:hypothetical protein
MAPIDPRVSKNLPEEARNPHAEFWDYVNGLAIAGILLGVGGGLYAFKVHKVIEGETVILLAMAGASVAVLAVILTATALMAGLLQGFFGLVIQTGDGLRKFFLPIKIVSGVSATAALAGFAGAINASSGPEWVKASLFGLASGLTTWSILGTVWITVVFIRYAVKQREKLTDEELEDDELEKAREEELERRAAFEGVAGPGWFSEMVRALRDR